MRVYSAPLLLVGLLASGPARAENCNAVLLEDGTSFVGCNLGVAVLIPNCQGATSNCSVTGDLQCNASQYSIGTTPYYHCPAIPPLGSLAVAPATQLPDEEARKEAIEEAARKLELETQARRKALEEELARKGATVIENQNGALQAANDVSFTGMTQAAAIGAIWCAHGATVQPEDRDLAEKSYGNCKQYLGAADQIQEQRGRNEPLTPDPNSLTGQWAEATLSNFEKKFGLERADYLSRLLSASDRGAELSQMTEGKLKPGELAEAFANGRGDEGKFLQSIASKEPKKSSLRADLKKALAAADKRKPSSEAAPKEAPVALQKIRGLTPLENEFADLGTVELTIFQVVHRKYLELSDRL